MNTDLWNQIEAEVTSCRKCPRLVEWREKVALEKRRAYRDWTYWGRPVPGFGDRSAQVLIVGLAPGAHGANRTGRMFTGDSSGDFLYRALYKVGFANQPTSDHAGDGLELRDIYISASCRCAPPDNKPLPAEVTNCLPFLKKEMALLAPLTGIVVLGRIGFDTILRVLREQGISLPPMTFGHGSFYELGNDLPWLLSSYHPSRQNTQTGRLTPEMFDAIWSLVREKLDPRKGAQSVTPVV